MSTSAPPNSRSLFTSADGKLVPSTHARGPWDHAALHGGAPAALIAAAFERDAAAHGLVPARLGFEFLRPIPLAALELADGVLRDGRRVRQLGAVLSASGQAVCRASAVCVLPVPEGLPLGPDDLDAGPSMPGPDAAEPILFTLDDTPTEDSFAATAMEMRWLRKPGAPGPARVWMRMRLPLRDGEPATPLALAAGAADFANGISRVLPFADYLFINADLDLHVRRLPRGEWVGLEARTTLMAGGGGLTETVLHDLEGPFGRSFQTLVVQARPAGATG